MKMSGGNKMPAAFMYGHGAKTCAEFTQQYAAEREMTSLFYYCWFQGFLTSFNLDRNSRGQRPLNYAATPLQILDDQGFLRLYCAEHPDELFIQAALKLINTRMKERGL